MPETKTGTCPWCERHQQTLFFTVGYDEQIGLWTEWLCARCRQICRELPKRMVINDGDTD